MEKYKLVIEHLKKKVPDKEINWYKILRATQETKESVRAYYESLMQVYSKYSAVKDPEKEGISGFVTAFIYGLHPEISSHIQHNVMCW